jgi:hypothetical protein
MRSWRRCRPRRCSWTGTPHLAIGVSEADGGTLYNTLLYTTARRPVTFRSA